MWIQILFLLKRILHNQGWIMSAIDDLRAKVEELQATVDADQAGDAAVVAAMQQEIDRLQGELANGASASDIADVVARLEAIKQDVAGPNTDPNS